MNVRILKKEQKKLSLKAVKEHINLKAPHRNLSCSGCCYLLKMAWKEVGSTFYLNLLKMRS